MFGGRLADLIGRRRILVVGLTIFSLSSLLAGLAGSAGSADHRPWTAGIRRRADRADRALDPGRHVRRGTRAQPCAGDLRRRRRNVGVDRRDRQRPADRRPRLALGVLHQRADRRAADRVGVRRARARTTPSGARASSTPPARRPSPAACCSWSTPSTAAPTTAGPRRRRCSLFGVAGLLLAAFVGIEGRSQAPLVPGAALRHRTLVAANLSAFFTFGAFFSFIFLGSLHDAAGARLLADQDRRVVAGDVGDGVHRLRPHRCAAGEQGRRPQAARHRPHAAGARDAVAGTCAGRCRLRVRPAACVPRRRRGDRLVRTVGPDQRLVGCGRVVVGDRLRPGRDDA